MEHNFAFLEQEFPVLAYLGRQAENACERAPGAALEYLGDLDCTILDLMCRYDRISLPDHCTLERKVTALYREGLLSQELVQTVWILKEGAEGAAHCTCDLLLPMAHSLCQWFWQVYGQTPHQSRPPVLAEEAQTAGAAKPADLEALRAQAEQAALAAAPVSRETRRRRAQLAAGQCRRSEAETRCLIDWQLRQVGWEADTEHLRFSKGTRPAEGRNLAIAEWPTDSQVGEFGRADYALFAGLKLVGIIEAKASYQDIPSVIDYQGKDYPRNLRAEDAEFQVGTWGAYKVPFTFATNGRPYLEQYRTKSGIWCLDLRAPDNVPYALPGWMSPDGILERLKQDPEAGNRALQQTPYTPLQDPHGLNLRTYQVQAVQAAEQAIMAGARAVLLAMATGTGKTRTILGLLYRLLEAGRFRRALLLVDRTALGSQALDVFQEVKLKEGLPLAGIYSLMGLEGRTPERETRLQVATVQGMVQRLFYHRGESMPAVTDYDLIVVDEAHRGYLLDQERPEEEALYRDQRDYQSKYRSVIDYFDAVKVALTATPTRQTTEIFGQPVFQYSYREAVIDGYLVDHDAPHDLHTRLRDEGIHYRPGDQVALYDPVTGEITNSELLEDELDFEVEQFNRKVITRSFNEAVLSEIARQIDPENPEQQGKTLIYAVDDQHADMIVDILKNIYAAYGVDNDAVMKITGSVGGGNQKKIQEDIRRFRNERYPSIVVTVDLLTTGIDVPQITRLVFLRRVKSRVLFEQMLGRATRPCPELHKTHFEIYDPVGVYESMQEVSTMKAVAANPAATFAQLLEELEGLEDPTQTEAQIDQILAKLQRRRRTLDEAALEQFTALTGGLDPEQLLGSTRRQPPARAKAFLLGQRNALQFLQQIHVNQNRPVVLSKTPDVLTGHTRSYGPASSPRDDLEAFGAFVKAQMEELEPLQMVCTHPEQLTREQWRALQLALGRAGFTRQRLCDALLALELPDCGLIGLIRHCGVGAALIGHGDRVRGAAEKLRNAHRFSAVELRWVAMMERYLTDEMILTPAVFDEDVRFRGEGGFRRGDKIFQGRLNDIVQELNGYLYDDGGTME